MSAAQGMDMTATETKTLTTLRADELQPGDVVRLLDNAGGDCTVLQVLPQDDSRVTLFLSYWQMGSCCLHPSMYEQRWITLALWKYSRVEIYSDVKGRGHLATPMQVAATESVSMEEAQA